MKVRAHLLAVAVAALLPLLAFAMVASYLVLRSEWAALAQVGADRARAVGAAVDELLKGSIGAAETLAASRSLESGNFAAFRAEAQRVLARRPEWANVHLAVPSGREVFSLAAAPGHALPEVAEQASFERAIRTGKPAVGDIPVDARRGGPPRVALRIPVIWGGRIPYVLSVMLKLDAIGALLAEQDIPPGSVGMVVDRGGVVLARTLSPESTVGRPAPAALREAMAHSHYGVVHGMALEGGEVQSPFRTSAFSGWTVSIGIPAESYDAGLRRTVWLLAAGVLAALGLAAGLAAYFGRRIAQPVASLAAAAEAIGLGLAPKPLAAASGVTELDQLAVALDEAAARNRAREQAQKAAEAQLRALDRSKDEFLAALSHELRNPLAAMTAAAHVMRLKQGSPEAVAQASGVFERQTQQMSRLVEDLLDVSRVTFGKANLEPRVLDLGAAVAQLAATWRAAGRFEQHRVTVETAPVWVRADEARIEQIASNLLDNALKYTPPGGAIRLGVAQRGGGAVVTVEDSGKGFAPESGARLFDLFSQDGGEARPAGGLGIGLALVKRLVGLHGGTVAAQSAGEGWGAAFTVTLPAVPAPPAEAPRAGKWAERPAEAHGCRVLIVEDNEDVRQMLRASLEIEGHEVRVAADAGAALEAAAGQPDLVLIDIGLPGMDGYELARRLRSRQAGRRMMLVALTGYGEESDRRRAREAGFDAHLTKPVHPERIAELAANVAA